MKALLLGAGGVLGRALAAAAPQQVDLVALDRAALDITDAAALSGALNAVRPEIVLNAAAYTAVDRAESEPELAHAVNTAAVASLGSLASVAGARVVHFSTDYVFDGRDGAPYDELAAPAPLGTYGRTKLAGERGLLASGVPALIVRTQWLYGQKDGFPIRMLERARSGIKSRVVNDQRGRPTAVHDLAPAIWRATLADADGIMHIAGGGEATWFDVAEAVFAHAGRPDLLSPCATLDFPTPAPRPADSRLDCTRAERLLGAPLPHWRTSLAAMLARTS